MKVYTTFESFKENICAADALRMDLIEYSLRNLGLRDCFTEIFANTADLRFKKEDLAKQALKKAKKCDFFIGDKEEDIFSGKKVKGKTIYVTWGVTEKDYEHIADFVASKPEDIIKIIEKK